MPRNTTPVYSVHGNLLRRVTVSQAEELLDLGTAKRVSRPKAPLKVQLLGLERADTTSPASISYSEVLANVGVPMDGFGREVSASRMRQVREKVAGFAVPSWSDRLVTA